MHATISHSDREQSDHLVAICGYSAVADVQPMQVPIQFHYVPHKTSEGGLVGGDYTTRYTDH